MSTLQLKARWSEDDYVASYFARLRRLRLFIGLMLLALLTPVAGVALFLSQDFALACLCWLIPLLFLLQFLLLIPRRIRHQYRHSDKLQQQRIWDIDAQGICIRTSDLAEIWRWHEFSGYQFCRQMTLLHLKPSGGISKVILHKYLNDTELSQLHQLIKQHLTPCN